MSEQENKIKRIVGTITGPFAFSGIVLVVLLSLLEFFRHGFVSLFLDMRIVFVVVLVILSIAIWCAPPIKRIWPSLVAIILLVAALIPVLWKLTAPYGRLGLVVLVGGIAAGLMLVVASLKKN